MTLPSKIRIALSTLAIVAGYASIVHAQTSDAVPAIPAACFKQDECGVGKFKNSFAVQSAECSPFTPFAYNCISTPPPIKLSIPIGNNTSVTGGLQKYISIIYSFLIGIAGIIAGIVIVIGGAQWLTAAGDKTKITAARKRITDALIGLVLVLGAYTLLYTVNPALLNLQLAPIRMMREENFSTPFLGECDSDAECRAEALYSICATGAVGSGSTGKLTIETKCEKKTANEQGIKKFGKCVIKKGQICQIEPYACYNVLDVVGRTLTFDLKIKSGSFQTNDFGGGFAACEQGTSCVKDGVFPHANKTFDPALYKCLAGNVGGACSNDESCPAGTICLTPRENPSNRFCGALSGPKKGQGIDCRYHQECESGRCNESTGVCTVVGGSPEGIACRYAEECASRICATSLTPDACAPIGGLPVGSDCDNSHECGQCSNFDAQGRGTWPPSCRTDRFCVRGICQTTQNAPGQSCRIGGDCTSGRCNLITVGEGFCQ